MKKKLILLTMLFSPILLFGQIWSYPVRPGTEVWNNLKTEKERIEAMQIPVDILNKMSTDDIIYACINFPLFGYYSAFNSPQEGFNIMFMKFNIFSKLCEKKDLVKKLIPIYKNAGLDGWIDKKNSLDNKYWTLKFSYLEYFLGQNEILVNMTEEEKIELTNLAIIKYEEKKLNESYNSISGISSSLFLLTKIMNTNEKMKHSLLQIDCSEIIRTGLITRLEDINKILNYANNFIKILSHDM